MSTSKETNPPSPAHDRPQHGPNEPHPHKGHKGLWIGITVVIVAAALVVWRIEKRAKPERARPAVPVTTATARTGDLDIFITALGSVNPWNSVTVHSQVDGKLLSVNFTEGQHVKAGDVLAEIDPRQFQSALEQAEGQLAKDQAQLENSKRDLQRYQDAQEAVTKQQVDAASAAVAGAEGTVQADQAAVDNDRLQLSYCKIVAPIDGVAGLRQLDAGNLIHVSDTNGLVVITQNQPIAVVFTIPEDNLPQVQAARKTGEPLRVDAYDSAMTTRITSGEVFALDNQIDTTTGTVKIKAKFANEENELFPNQFVNVRLLVETQKGVTLVPVNAVQIGPQGRFVFVLKQDNTVEQRAVTVGRTEGEDVAIAKGIAPGEIVVTEGLDKLRDGAQVAAHEKIPDAAPSKTPGRNRKGAGKKRS